MSSGTAQATASHPRARARASWRRLVLDRVLPLAVIGLAYGAIAVTAWPGRMDADTLNEIYQTMHGVYSDQWSPVLLWLWHPFFTAGFGPGWMLSAQILLFMVGAYLLLRLAFRPLGAAVAMAIICLLPPVLGQLSLVGRDAWFAGLTLAGFGATARALHSQGRARLAWGTLVLVSCFLSLASRQNAAPTSVVPLVILIGAWLMHRRPGLRRLTAVGISVVAGVVLTLGLMGSQRLLSGAIGVQPSPVSLSALYIYDLASISRQEGHNVFPASVVGRDRSMAMIHQLTTVDSINAVLTSPTSPVHNPLRSQDTHALQAAWQHQLTTNPIHYLRSRVGLFTDLIGLTQNSFDAFHPGIDGNYFGYSPSFAAAHRVGDDYLQAFADPAQNGDALFAVWVYLLVCCSAAWLYLRRRTVRGVVIGGLALSALTYQVGLFFGVMGSDYRYEFPSVAIALLIAAISLRLAGERDRLPAAG